MLFGWTTLLVLQEHSTGSRGGCSRIALQNVGWVRSPDGSIEAGLAFGLREQGVKRVLSARLPQDAGRELGGISSGNWSLLDH